MSMATISTVEILENGALTRFERDPEGDWFHHVGQHVHAPGGFVHKADPQLAPLLAAELDGVGARLDRIGRDATSRSRYAARIRPRAPAVDHAAVHARFVSRGSAGRVRKTVARRLRTLRPACRKPTMSSRFRAMPPRTSRNCCSLLASARERPRRVGWAGDGRECRPRRSGTVACAAAVMVRWQTSAVLRLRACRTASFLCIALSFLLRTMRRPTRSICRPPASHRRRSRGGRGRRDEGQRRRPGGRNQRL